MTYLGHLSREDPLYGYLRRDILPELGVEGDPPDFRVYRIPASNHVYLYEDGRSGARLIGKFFDCMSNGSSETAFYRMEREFNNLHRLRRIGFAGYPHDVARPLGLNRTINSVLVEEFCCGTPLADFIVKAIREGETINLLEKLTALAYFLATLHNRTATSDRVSFDEESSYFHKVIYQLAQRGHIGTDEAQKLYRLKDQWREKGFMWEDNQVIVHGDVTPANILLGDRLQVAAIDLEHMKPADRVFDIGMVTGEIKHLFMEQTGDRLPAEPFIGHFLWEYACHFPDRDRAFAAVTRRIPFYMGLTLLRIARNSWINDKYRRRLLNEAINTLE